MQAKTDKEQLTNEARAEGKIACTMPCKEKEDESQIEALYREMYKAMVEKDTATLNRVHADNFVLTHMTGMHQSKQEYITSRSMAIMPHLQVVAGSMLPSLEEVAIRGVCNYISTLSKKMASGGLWQHVLQHIENSIGQLVDL